MSKQSNPQVPEALEHRLQEFLAQVRTMPRGGDLEGLIEDHAAEMKQLLYDVAARQRQQTAAAEPAAFPPSGLPSLPAGDAVDR